MLKLFCDNFCLVHAFGLSCGIWLFFCELTLSLSPPSMKVSAYFSEWTPSSWSLAARCIWPFFVNELFPPPRPLSVAGCTCYFFVNECTSPTTSCCLVLLTFHPPLSCEINSPSLTLKGLLSLSRSLVLPFFRLEGNCCSMNKHINQLKSSPHHWFTHQSHANLSGHAQSATPPLLREPFFLPD